MLVRLVMMAFSVSFALAMSPAQGQAQQGALAAPSSDSASFDPRDLSGFWIGNSYDYSANVPEFTAEGQKRFEANVPSYGLPRGTLEAAESDQHVGRRRAVPPALGNDPVGDCNPLGLIRLLLFRPSPIEIVQTPDKIIQIFEWSWDLREIWTDGRELPADIADAYLPRFDGYSVGRWEEDTLVVETVGFDERAWIDRFGYPMSSEAHLEERWRRVDGDTIELNLTLTDPVVYASAWEATPVTFRRYPEEDMTYGGWTGLVPDRCVPADEQFFNRTARDPAGGVVNE